jgi:predicted enzyme related to lactoylglutathione lyase
MEAVKNPFAWTEIYVEDMHRAQKFYETVLNIKMQQAAMPEGMDAEEGSDEYFEMVFFPANMELHGSGGALVKSAMFRPGGGGTMIYFACDDCAVEISRVADAGGSVLNEKMSLGEYGYCGICMDTEGNPIGFHSMA